MTVETRTRAAQWPTRLGVFPAFVDSATPACEGTDPELFYPLPGANRDVALAKAICLRCPLKARCLSHAMAHELWGVWGGTTERERTRMRRVAR